MSERTRLWLIMLGSAQPTPHCGLPALPATFRLLIHTPRASEACHVSASHRSSLATVLPPAARRWLQSLPSPTHTQLTSTESYTLPSLHYCSTYPLTPLRHVTSHSSLGRTAAAVPSLFVSIRCLVIPPRLSFVVHHSSRFSVPCQLG